MIKPKTPEEVIAFIGRNYDLMITTDYPKISDSGELSDWSPGELLPLEDIVYSLTVHDLLSAFREWRDSWGDVSDMPTAEDLRLIARAAFEKLRGMRLINGRSVYNDLRFAQEGLAIIGATEIYTQEFRRHQLLLRSSTPPDIAGGGGGMAGWRYATRYY